MDRKVSKLINKWLTMKIDYLIGKSKFDIIYEIINDLKELKEIKEVQGEENE